MYTQFYFLHPAGELNLENKIKKRRRKNIVNVVNAMVNLVLKFYVQFPCRKFFFTACFKFKFVKVYIGVTKMPFTSVVDPELLPGSGIIVPDPAKGERA